MSGVTGGTCQVSHVRCKYYYFNLFFAQSGWASWWRVFYQRGLTRLVFIYSYPLFRTKIILNFFTHSQSMKMRMLANKGLSRLLNMSPDLEWKESVKVIIEFAVKI